MKTTLLYGIVALSFMARLCNPEYRESTRIYFENKSNYWVDFTFPDEKTSLYEDLDTTMTSYHGRVCQVDVLPHTSRRISSPADTFEDWIPKGSEFFSLFVFEQLPGSSGSELYKNDLYYVRYDLTLDDIYSLCDNNGVLLVSYPPSPEMKHIRMWPPYEEVIENTEKTKF
ncbi:MAG: hypothetical protein ACI3ZQ_10160 [Candidatus Cryptobacteroides sp.]